MDHIFFIHSSVERHLGSFQSLAIVDNAAMNIGVHMALLFTMSVFWGKYPVVQLLDHRLAQFLTFFFKILFIYSTEIETASERGNTSRGSGRGRSRLISEEPDVGSIP